MPISKKIVIHIGAHKTGSTYIQKRLRNAANLRADHGVYYPILPVIKNMAGNAKLLPIAIDKRATHTFKHVYPDINVHQLDAAIVLNDLTKEWLSSKETLVLSAENLRSHHALSLRELLPNDANIRIVLFVRNQFVWFESYYNQLVKSNETSKRIRSFVDDLCDNQPPDLLFPDWYALYDAYFSVFGHCEVLVYDEVKSDLFGSFCYAADLHSVAEIPDIPRVQVSTSALQTAYLLSIGSTISKKKFLSHKAASTKAIKGFAGKTMTFLSYNDREKIRANFQDSNDKLVVKLGRTSTALELDVMTESKEYCDLDKLYQSQDYSNYLEQIKQVLK